MSRPEPSEPLVLRPVEAEDVGAVSRLLSEPKMRRRNLISGLHVLHPLDWSERRRTFVIESGDALVGTAELLRDDEDPDTWEFSLAVRGGGAGTGGRCAATTLHYAFEILGAGTVWFWVPVDNVPIHRLADRFGFSRLHRMRLPAGGAPAEVFELDADTWRARRAQAFEQCLPGEVLLRDREHTWRGTAAGEFLPVAP